MFKIKIILFFFFLSLGFTANSFALEAIVSPGFHSLALHENGTLFSWGPNTGGRLGDGTEVDRYNPVQVKYADGSIVTGITQIATTDFHNLALKSNGTLLSWGVNDPYGNTPPLLGDGTDINRHNPVQVKYADGSIVTGITQIAAAGLQNFALKSDGTLLAWGENSAFQLGDGTQIDRHNPVQVRHADGSIVSGITQIAAADYHNLALKLNGTLLAWGINDYGEIGDGTQIDRHNPVQVRHADGSIVSGITQIAVGINHSLALKSDGSVLAWGANFFGSLGDSTETDRHNPVQVKSVDGSIVTGITQIAAAASSFFNFALKSDGTLLAWGSNWDKNLGDGTRVNRFNPVNVIYADGSIVTGIEQIAAGYYHNLAIKSDRTVLAWGSNYSGRLGDGTTIRRDNPIHVKHSDGSPLYIKNISAKISLFMLPIIANNTCSKKLSIAFPGDGNGNITISPSGEVCNKSYEKTFECNQTVTLTASPSAKSRFSGWSGCDTSSGSSCTVKMDLDKSVSALFEYTECYTISNFSTRHVMCLEWDLKSTTGGCTEPDENPGTGIESTSGPGRCDGRGAWTDKCIGMSLLMDYGNIATAAYFNSEYSDPQGICVSTYGGIYVGL